MVYRSASAQPDSEEVFDPELARFLGLWVDTHGRALFVKRVGNSVQVSVSEGITEPPYKQSGLVFDFPTIDLEARLKKPGVLEVEAGSPGLGPTYQLELQTSENNDVVAANPHSGDDRLLPTVHMGLYDDYDDDLGVPWAFPLAPYRRATPRERDEWSRGAAGKRNA